MKKEAKAKVKCPGCNKMTTWEGNKWRPFCSERCKMLDIGAWASEDYKAPSLEDEFEESTKNLNYKNGEYH